MNEHNISEIKTPIGQISNPATHHLKRISLATLALASFALLTGTIANTFFHPTHAEEIQIGAAVGAGFVQITDGACSAANTANQPAYDATNNILNIDVMPGANASNCLGVTVTTDNTQGYSMTIQGPDTGNLVLAGQSIAQKDGTMAVPAVFTNQTYGGAWGFAIPKNQIQDTTIANGFDTSYSVLPRDNTVNTAKYAAVPMNATTIDSVPTISGTGVFNYDVFFAVSAGAYAPTGTYTGTVTISAFGNAAIPPVPEITSIANTISVAYGTTSGPINVTTDVEANCKWNLNADFSYASGGTLFSDNSGITGSTIHSTTVTGLANGTNTIYVRCANIYESTQVSEYSSTSVDIATLDPTPVISTVTNTISTAYGTTSGTVTATTKGVLENNLYTLPFPGE